MNTHIKRPIAANSQAGLRNTIGNEIERLIAFLDYLDGDENLEDTLDTEDGDDSDREQDHADSEPALGWTDALDQTIPARTMSQCGHGEDEPEVGWCGNGKGWQEGEPLEEDEDEREFDQGESGIADSDGMFETWGMGQDGAMALKFEGQGTDSAVAMLRAVGLTLHQADARSPVCEPGSLILRITR